MNFDIESIKRKMLVKYPFFGSIVANIDYIENKNIQTAATNGKEIHYNPIFLEKLSSSEQTFLFAHEVCHIAFNHILRSEGKDHTIWNTATDAVINAFLKRDGLKMIEGVVDMDDAINYDAEQLYEKLLKEKKQEQEQNGQDNKNGQEQDQPQSSDGQNNSGSPSGDESKQPEENSSQSKGSSSSDTESQKKQNNQSSGSDEQTSDEEKQDVGHDTHSMWDEAIKKHKEELQNDKKENPLDSKKQKEIEKKKEEIEQLGEKEAFKKNLEEKKKELEELKKELSRQAIEPGSTTNGNIRNITDIGKAKPLIDWRYVLREAIKYDVDWSYKNATIENGVITAHLEEQPMPETEIVLDTSGSVNESLLKNFLRECKNILHHSKLKVGCFDTNFYGFHEIRTEKDIENMKFEGGGGTDFNVAVRAFSRRIENKIIFTDGYAHMPDMPLNAVWIVYGGIKINPKGGKVIQIDNCELERLNNCQINAETKRKSR